jgi:tRNA nucleotidyltransferase (CCA-adding enzyme)
VRDLLLERPVRDVDLAVEGDGVAFGRALARELGAGARIHERFGTVILETADGSRLDVASTRAEVYRTAGALPRVTRTSLALDLGRRDFTVNAMAIRIAPGRPALVDPLGGAADIDRKLIRMLHPGSPRDDPTRAFRAIRYANRLGFRIEPRTKDWIARAIESGAFEKVSGDRLRRELALLFSEEGRARAVALLAALDLIRVLEPTLPRDASVLARFRRAEALARRHPGKTSWFLFLLVWAAGLSDPGAARLGRRLALVGEELRALRRWPATLSAVRASAAGLTPSAALERGLSGDEIGAAVALTGSRRLEDALAAFGTRLAVRGRDLLAAGVPAGPRVGRALRATLSALADGRISREEELAFAIRAALSEAS